MGIFNRGAEKKRESAAESQALANMEPDDNIRGIITDRAADKLTTWLIHQDLADEERDASQDQGSTGR